MGWDGQAQRNYGTDAMTRTHHDIETMTRKLELEKRRLHRIEKEYAVARRTYQIRVQGTDGSRTSRRGGSLSASETGEVTQSVESESAFSTGAGGSTSSSTVLQGPVRALVNRLDVARKKLDSQNHDNVILREEVDGIRRRRLQLNTIFDRLKIEIRQRSAQLVDFVEETGASRTVLGDANQRVDVMKRHRELERRQFKTEVLRLRTALKKQDWKRKEEEVNLKKKDTGVQKKKELIIPEEETNFSEGEMMRRIMKTAFLNCIQRKHIKEHQKSIEVFEQAFATIKQSTGIEHIEEIVKIFVNLENRNFSLLTYVNVMNREIEALEGARRERQHGEEARHQFDAADGRQKALADMSQQLQAAELAIQEGHEVTAQHRQLIDEFLPILRQIAQRLEGQFEQLRATGASTADDMLKLPHELNEETVPEWLELIGSSLGRFRELLPDNAGDKAWAFPSTALGSVRTLAVKRFGHQAVGQALVKQQELPSSVTVVTDEHDKRAHAQMMATQKAETLDDESEEEDFDNRPLQLKELRSRAQKSQANRRARRTGQAANAPHRHPAGDKSSPRCARTNSAEISPAILAALDSSGPKQQQVVSALSGQPRSTTEAKEDEILEDGSVSYEDDGTDKARRSLLADAAQDKRTSALSASPNADDHGAFASPSPQKLGRGKLACQAVDAGVAEVSEEELDKCFLQRYKMTREELQVMADHMGIHIHQLFFLKQEFDQCDQEQSGYIDSHELKILLKKLGEDIRDDALDAAVKTLDTDGSGEIEFFEFVEWFTATD